MTTNAKGEAIYAEANKVIRREHPPEGTIDSLKSVVGVISEYAIPELQADENGQVPFLRSLLDAAVSEINASIARQQTDKETSEAVEGWVKAIPALCRGEVVPCAMHVSEPIRQLRTELSAVKQDCAHWVQLAKYQRDWFKHHHTAGINAGACPTDAAIAESEKLLGREIGYPK